MIAYRVHKFEWFETFRGDWKDAEDDNRSISKIASTLVGKYINY